MENKIVYSHKISDYYKKNRWWWLMRYDLLIVKSFGGMYL